LVGDIISERVKMGIANARAQGKHVGRPCSGYGDKDLAQIPTLRAEGLSYTKISERLGVPRTTVAHHARKASAAH
jgi:DNA invertase Pin-like site-specific DNA recombinase